ncbi:hypothetical protein [Massilia aurea]|uniref:hypothetical protein n=1 Tax=Massilia aurea TaxID=373040 RepID=UPI0011CDD2A7|nr:hypothetical protein [Massilia aurea]
MQFQATRQHAPYRAASAPLRRVLACLCALILALQLVGASFHDHDLSEQLSDCVSCQIASHSTADLPAASPQLLALFLVIAFVFARLPRPAPVVLRRYLIPSRQAPPRH